MLPCKFCGCIQLLLFSRLTILVRNANATNICKWQTTATLVQYSDRLKSSSLGKVKKKRNRLSLPSKRGSKKNISLLFGPISFRHLTAVLSLDFFIRRCIFLSFLIPFFFSGGWETVELLPFGVRSSTLHCQLRFAVTFCRFIFKSNFANEF